MTPDEKFMQRAMELAHLGIGNVSPNPLVGCVIVHENVIVGEGWHQLCGKAHAEVNALNSVVDKSVLNQCSVYVNLEPCAHTGKTPPCADKLVEAGVKRVVIANEDPNPLVSGKGIHKLLNARIKVEFGVLEKEGRHLNRRFFTFIKKKRPWVILKWAETADGFIARENNSSKWISNEYSRQLVHKWRSEEDAILVGYNSAMNDNPKLSVRDWTGRNPLRVVIDNRLTLDKSLHLFDQSQMTICYNFEKDEELPNLYFVKLEQSDWINGLLSDLAARNIQSIIVEGGTKTLNYFLHADLWDEARIFKSKEIFGRGIMAPDMNGLTPQFTENIHGDTLGIYSNNK